MTGRLGLVVHQHRPEVVELAGEALAWAERVGVEVVAPFDDAALVGLRAGLNDEHFGEELDACLSIGGDGTMLRASAMVSEYGVPILGVNAGHLGYLTETEPSGLVAALDDWRAGALAIEERMLLAIRLDDDPEPSALALNEVVVDRAESGHSVRVEVRIGARVFHTYLVDGLICATPTGSTAYSLSAGGPIVEPDFEAMILTPVSPHHVFNRALVVSPTTEIQLTVTGYRHALVVVDGQTVAELEPGRTVRCRRAGRKARFLVRGDRDFHSILKEKFGLADR